MSGARHSSFSGSALGLNFDETNSSLGGMRDRDAVEEAEIPRVARRATGIHVAGCSSGSALIRSRAPRASRAGPIRGGTADGFPRGLLPPAWSTFRPRWASSIDQQLGAALLAAKLPMPSRRTPPLAMATSVWTTFFFRSQRCPRNRLGRFTR